MHRLRPRREDYIPPHAIKRVDPHSNAIAYPHTDRGGQYVALVFVGRQSRPTVFLRYRQETDRDHAIDCAFEAARARLQAKADQRTARTATNQLECGDILSTNWGYDQTNREFFEVIACNGKHVTVREVRQDRQETNSMQGVCRPIPGAFIGEKLRRLVQYGTSVRIDRERDARKWNTGRVDGIPVGPDLRWSSYA